MDNSTPDTRAIWTPHKGQQTLALSINESVYEILYGGA